MSTFYETSYHPLNVEVADARNDDHVRHYPHADQRGDDGPDDSKGESPSHNGFGNHSYDGRDNQVDDDPQDDVTYLR